MTVPVEKVRTPSTWGPEAQRYLEYHALYPIKPTIRSSDYYTSLRDPFFYYLTRRLGLSTPFSYTEALNRGDWFHQRARLAAIAQAPAHPDPSKILDDLLTLRQKELSSICAALGITGTSLDKIQDRERQDAYTSWAWWDATHTLMISPTFGSISSYLKRPYWHLLGREVRLTVPTPPHLKPKAQRVAQLDLLLHQKENNSLWILDWKTCSVLTHIRLQTCPIEFQTQHYLSILEEALKLGILHKTYPDLPKDVRIGGMLHVAVQKPTISFDKRIDRPSRIHTRELTRGPNKGQLRSEREYHGDPDISFYLDRVKEWYQAEGRYASQKPLRESSPPTNISVCPFTSVLDTIGHAQYHARLTHLHSMATRPAHPGNFLMNPHSVHHSTPTPWDAFYTCPIEQWPDIVKKESLVVRTRDDDLDENQFHSLEETPMEVPI